MRERAEIDAIFGRVRAGEHYTVLGVAEDAQVEAIQRSHVKLSRWIEGLEDRPEVLGDYQSRVQLISNAVQNAWRILGNPTMRLRYDEQRRFVEPSEKTAPARPSELRGEVRTSTGGEVKFSGGDIKSTMPDVFTQREVRDLMDAATVSRPSRVQGLLPTMTGRTITSPDPSPGASESRTALMVALLEAHLGAAFGSAVSLVSLTGESALVYGRRAEDAETRGDWLDAVVLWHAALLASPDDVALVRRAASAMKAAGASSDLLRGYNHRADVMDHTNPPDAGARVRKHTR